jgi:RecB family exonuclease
MASAYKTSMEQFGSKMKVESRKEVFAMADQYLKRITANKGQLKTVLSVEKNFALDIGGKVILNGMIDKVQTDADGILHVMDYKSTKNKKYLKNDWLQLLTYAYILYTENQNIERIRGSYVLLRHGFEHITKEFTLPEILDIKNRFEAYAKEISNATLYPASPSRLCEWCLAVDQCDEGKQYLGIGTGEMDW